MIALFDNFPINNIPSHQSSQETYPSTKYATLFKTGSIFQILNSKKIKNLTQAFTSILQYQKDRKNSFTKFNQSYKLNDCLQIKKQILRNQALADQLIEQIPLKFKKKLRQLICLYESLLKQAYLKSRSFDKSQFNKNQNLILAKIKAQYEEKQKYYQTIQSNLKSRIQQLSTKLQTMTKNYISLIKEQSMQSIKTTTKKFQTNALESNQFSPRMNINDFGINTPKHKCSISDAQFKQSYFSMQQFNLYSVNQITLQDKEAINIKKENAATQIKIEKKLKDLNTQPNLSNLSVNQSLFKNLNPALLMKKPKKISNFKNMIRKFSNNQKSKTLSKVQQNQEIEQYLFQKEKVIQKKNIRNLLNEMLKVNTINSKRQILKQIALQVHFPSNKIQNLIKIF